MSVRQMVNAGLLSHSLGKKVSIIGRVLSVEPNGNSFKLMATDDVTVNVKVSPALDSLLEGYVEVYGTCYSKDTIVADDYIEFTAEQTRNLNHDKYNQMCALLQQVPDVYATR